MDSCDSAKKGEAREKFTVVFLATTIFLQVEDDRGIQINRCRFSMCIYIHIYFFVYVQVYLEIVLVYTYIYTHIYIYVLSV